MKVKLVPVAMLLFGFLSAPFLMADDGQNGPADIDLNGGNKGNISFPHRQHQERLGDCNICHNMFPKAHDAVKTLKAEKKLKKNQVMNKLCVSCHKREKKAGRDHGPVSCSACHKK